MAAEFERLSKLEFFKWKKEDENWAAFLAELRTAILMTQRQVNTRAARTKELATSGQRDNLVNLMTVQLSQNHNHIRKDMANYLQMAI